MEALAILALAIHLVWIIWVIGGAFWTRGRMLLTTFHVLSLAWGIIVELSPWPCPLTLAEQYFEHRGGVDTYKGGFLLHNLDRLVYPAIPDAVVTGIGVAVCALNLAVYLRRYWKHQTDRPRE
jgi:Protein of Unknown function (DUF2784)